MIKYFLAFCSETVKAVGNDVPVINRTHKSKRHRALKRRDTTPVRRESPVTEEEQRRDDALGPSSILCPEPRRKSAYVIRKSP
ncbi:hypothetical protein NDU88_006375 [Pleurodeles waltl]|uniref:Uncharacterized protein n=1 Tax=Pleurodeles waltl TaxID=8319 RepID=A0AAV7PL94_PLEWA|nr:hypothetical protein NDU88_006375 [Pleurodeles waltl]